MKNVEGVLGLLVLQARHLWQHQALAFQTAAVSDLSWPRLPFPRWSWGCGTGGTGCTWLWLPGAGPVLHGHCQGTGAHSALGIAAAMGMSAQGTATPPRCMHRLLSCSQSCGFIPLGLLFAFETSLLLNMHQSVHFTVNCFAHS